MAGSIAAVTEEENQKLVRSPKEHPVPNGGRQKAWIEFLDSIAAREPDHDFMSERPMNRIPAPRDVFACK